MKNEMSQLENDLKAFARCVKRGLFTRREEREEVSKILAQYSLTEDVFAKKVEKYL